jgi:hypothetical protein
LSEEFPEKLLITEFTVVMDIFFNYADQYAKESGADYQLAFEEYSSIPQFAVYLIMGTSGVYLQSNLTDSKTT